jgi:hypothetical protein
MSDTAAMTDKRLKEIEARAAKATPGPWQWHTSNSWRRLKRDGLGILQNVAEPYVVHHDKHPDLAIVGRAGEVDKT